MNEWKEVLLTDITTRIGDGLHGTPYYDNTGEYYFINGNNLVNGRIIIKDDTKRVNKSEFQKHAKPINERTLLVGINGTIGNIAYYNNEKCMLGKSVCYANLKDEVEIRYIYYTFLNRDFQNYIEGIATGTTIPNVPLKGIREYSFKIPPLAEQKSIASILSSLDDKIDLLHRQNTTLETMAETLFRQWFVEEAKEEWEEKKLDDLLLITSSKRIFYSEYVNFGIPFYRSKEIIELHNTGGTNSELFISEQRFNEIGSKFGSPKNGDILLTSVGTLGIPYKVKINDKFYFKDGNLTWFKDFKNISSNIIYCWLKSGIGKEQLDGITIGSTQAALTISGLKEIKLKIPPKHLLAELDSKLEIIYNKIESNQIQIRTLATLRDTLLPKLMSGEIRVN